MYKGFCKFTAFLLTGVLLLCGCGQETGDTTSGSDVSVSSSSDTSENTVVLTLVTSGYGSSNELKTYIEENFDNIRLEVTSYPDEQFYATLKMELADGDGPDFVACQTKYAGENSVYRLAKAGYLEPLDDVDCKIFDDPEILDAVSLDGIPYGYASKFLFTLGVTYNKDMFKDLGLSVPENWQEFLDCCQTLKGHGITPLITGDRDTFVFQYALYPIAANIIYSKDPDYDTKLWEGKARFTDSGTWDTCLSMYKELYDKGYVAEDTLKYNIQTSWKKFYAGEAAMSFGFPGMNGAEDEDSTLDLGIFALPANDEGQPTYIAVSTVKSCTGVNATSAHKELAKQILTDYYNSMEIQDPLDSADECYIEPYKEGHVGPICNMNWPSGLENELEEDFVEYIQGNLTVDEVTEKLQDRFEELKDRFEKSS